MRIYWKFMLSISLTRLKRKDNTLTICDGENIVNVLDVFLNDLEVLSKEPDKYFEYDSEQLVEFDVYYDVELGYKSKEYEIYNTKLKELGIEELSTGGLEVDFTKKDMDSASFLSLCTYYDYDYDAIKHPSFYGTIYEKVIVCDKCGLCYYKQMSPIHWNTNLMKKKDFIEIPSIDPLESDQYHSGHPGGGYSIIISQRLANILEKEGCTGYRLEPVIHVGKPEKDRHCYQLIITSIMPAMSNRTEYFIYPLAKCPSCREIGMHTWSIYKYDESALGECCDFNFTLEKSHAHHMQPLTMILSQKVRKILKDLKVLKLFKPIIVVKEE